MERIERLLSKIQNPQLSCELRKLFGELHSYAFIDSLTGLNNRRYFDDQLEVELERAKKKEQALSILFIDVDNFKAVNDRLGHPIGDQVLRDVAAKMKENLRRVDLITRFGGEEFAVILPGSDKGQAASIAERIRKAVEDGIFLGQKLTISCGVASFPAHATDSASLVLLADRAMYCAKATSKNKVMIAGQFQFMMAKKATLGYLTDREKPVSIWVEEKFFPVHSWKQIGKDPLCFLAQSNRELLFLQKRPDGWFLME